MHPLAVARLDDFLMLALGRALDHLHSVVSCRNPFVDQTNGHSARPANQHTPVLPSYDITGLYRNVGASPQARLQYKDRRGKPINR